MSDTAVPSEGALTLAQATTALIAPQAVQDDTSQPREAPEVAASETGDEPDEQTEQTQGEASAEGDASEAAEPGDGEQQAEEGAEAVEPLTAPAYWSREAKDKWAELPRWQQEVVLAQEGPREAATAKAKSEAAEARKNAEAQSQGVQNLAEQLNSFLPEALQTFQQRWGEPDWEATIVQYGAEEAAKLRARYDRERGQLQQLTQAQQRATAEAHRAYVQEEWARLAEFDPELAPDVKDPTKGAEKRQEVTKYLLDAGIGRDAVAQISATELSMARKAMLWDRAQEAAKAAKVAQPNKPQPPQRSAVRPAAAPAGSPQQRTAVSVQNAFNSKPSVDNAVALLMARTRR